MTLKSLLLVIRVVLLTPDPCAIVNELAEIKLRETPYLFTEEAQEWVEEYASVNIRQFEGNQ